MLPEMFRNRYNNVFDANEEWNELKTSEGDLYEWDAESTYIQEPPFLVDLAARAGADQADQRRPRAGRAGRFGDDRPHLAGRLDRGQAARPAATCRSTASRRSISTATAPAAATTA